MPTYITLVKWTQQGIATIKEGPAAWKRERRR
jgi:hypothetical protein